MKPRQPSRSHAGKRWQFHQAPRRTAWEMRCRGSRSSPNLRRTTRAEDYNHMPADALKCKECSTDLPARGALRLRALLRPARGLLLAARRRARTSSSAGSRPARTRSGATPTSSRWKAPRARRCRPGWTPLVKADRLAERLGHRASSTSRTRPRTRRTRSRTASSRSRSPARRSSASTRIACASTGNLANAVAAHAAAAGLPAYVLIPADLEEQKILATGAYGANVVAVRGNYDDVNRLCTEVAGERADWAFVNVNMRPYYAEGSKTLAFEIVEQLGWELPGPRRRRRSPPARSSRRSRAASRSSSTPGWSRARCRT